MRPLSCVALVEDWCGDVIANLPVVAVLAREVGPGLELRCFIKADVPDLATRYLNHGRFESLPVFAFFDADWNEVGVFIERPVAVTERREEDRRAIYAANPEFGSPDAPASELDDDVRTRLMAEIQARRSAIVPWANRQVVVAIRDAIARAPAGRRARAAHAMSARVRIVYCAECGYEPQTLALADALMRRFGHDLASIELVPWLEGTFEVSVDGRLVHSMARDGGFPEHAAIIDAVTSSLAASSTT